ncbi:MAG: zf-HC2 domain-containing protein, partial [Gemmatimonadota bacterium]
MSPIVRHPGFRRLSLHADGDLDAHTERRVARHLEGCARCRAALDRIRRLDAEARALPTPALRSDALERVLARHGAGDRVLLPLADPPVRRAPRL